MEQLKELKKFCENHKVLKPLWKELVKASLRLRIIQSEIALALGIESKELFLKKQHEYQKRNQKYASAFSEFKRKCKKLGVKVPSFSHEEVCDLYID